jgi:hypothetical protein
VNCNATVSICPSQVQSLRQVLAPE